MRATKSSETPKYERRALADILPRSTFAYSPYSAVNSGLNHFLAGSARRPLSQLQIENFQFPILNSHLNSGVTLIGLRLCRPAPLGLCALALNSVWLPLYCADRAPAQHPPFQLHGPR
jgi:hypothetical protein